VNSPNSLLIYLLPEPRLARVPSGEDGQSSALKLYTGLSVSLASLVQAKTFSKKVLSKTK